MIISSDEEIDKDDIPLAPRRKEKEKEKVNEKEKEKESNKKREKRTKSYFIVGSDYFFSTSINTKLTLYFKTNKVGVKSGSRIDAYKKLIPKKIVGRLRDQGIIKDDDKLIIEFRYVTDKKENGHVVYHEVIVYVNGSLSANFNLHDYLKNYFKLEKIELIKEGIVKEELETKLISFFKNTSPLTNKIGFIFYQ